jgi:hypothetical protein
VLVVAVYKSPGQVWNDADITKLLSLLHKWLLAGDLKAKHPFWYSVISNPSDAKLLNLLHINVFEISAPQCPTPYSPAGNGDVLGIVVLRMFCCQKSLSLTFLTQITYQPFSTCWIMLELIIIRTCLTNSRVGEVSKPVHRINFTENIN